MATAQSEGLLNPLRIRAKKNLCWAAANGVQAPNINKSL